MDTSTKKLLNGSLVYFLGSALTQLLSLLLMRFVTGNISPEEYGFFNLVVTISNIAIPFASLQIADAVFKFVLKAESEDERKSYFTICFVISAMCVATVFIATFGLSCFIGIPHTFLVALYVASYAIHAIYQKIVRSLNGNSIIATGSIIKAIVFLLLEIVLLSRFDLGVEALLLAHILSTLISILYAEIRVHALKYFDLHMFQKKTFLKMLKFSVPLIPNAGFWWLTSSVNHVIVSARLGMDINGIYTVSNKFSGTLNLITNVLNMSWQDTAIAEYGKQGFDVFLTRTFNSFIKLIFSAIAAMIPLIAIVLPYMVDPSYYEAIPYVPFLLIAAGMSAMSGFMAQIFTGKGKTQSIMVTSLVGMITNVCMIAFFVSRIGLWAAVFGALVADMVMFGVRTFMARKEFAKGVDIKSFLIVFIILIISVFVYMKATPVLNLIWFLVTAAFAVILNWNFIKDLFSLICGRFFNKSKKGKK